MRTLIVSHGGRESALAMRMSEDSELHAFVGHENPSIVGYAASSGGTHHVGNVCDPHVVAAFARERDIDLAMVSADEPLAAGVVDALLAQGTAAVGPTRRGAEIEWNKEFARTLLAEIAPAATPMLRIVHDRSQVADAIASFDSVPVVVKPSGLTGGKGVKVMGPHLHSHDDAAAYALELLERAAPGDCVLIEEKIVGAEFTIQAISDGNTVVFPPSTYDYPYRYDGDHGPGTGGMGSLTMDVDTLPFMTDAHYVQACEVINEVIHHLKRRGRHFTGVMNSGFFATADGIKVVEFNARFGDPECVNIMSLLDCSWIDVMQRIAARNLSCRDVVLRPEASMVQYFVSPDYALHPGPAYDFTLDRAQIEAHGCHVFFSSAIQTAHNAYRTVGTSRAVALATTAPTLEQARQRILASASAIPVLQSRSDIGDSSYLQGLSELVQASTAAGAPATAPNVS